MPEAENTAKEGKATPTQKRIERTAAPNYASYYANNSEVGMTIYDISIRFGRIIGAEADVLHVEDQALVTMSLPHAKAVLHILNSYIAQYEKDNGITLPTPFVPLIEVEHEQDIPTGLYNVEGEKK